MHDIVYSSDGFTPLIAPVGPVTGGALWFIFRDNQILVHTSHANTGVPMCADPADLGLVTVRRQYLGMLAGQHCFSAEVVADAPLPAGLSCFGLRGLFGLLDDTLFALAGRAVQIMDWDRSHQLWTVRRTDGSEHRRASAHLYCL